MYTDMNIAVHSDVCADMRVDTCMELCIDMYVDVCIDVSRQNTRREMLYTHDFFLHITII